MDWLTFFLIVLGIGVVGILGGRIVIGRDRIEIDTPGLLENLRKAREGKGIPAPQSPSSFHEVEQARALVQRNDHKVPVADVLWVDDHPLNNLFERRALSKMGIFCDAFTSNDEAMAALNLNLYDLVISDYGRDNALETGGDLLRAIRNAGLDIPFIYYTFGVNDQVKSEALIQGAFAIVETPDQLVSEVLKTLSASVAS